MGQLIMKAIEVAANGSPTPPLSRLARNNAATTRQTLKQGEIFEELFHWGGSFPLSSSSIATKFNLFRSQRVPEYNMQVGLAGRRYGLVKPSEFKKAGVGDGGDSGQPNTRKPAGIFGDLDDDDLGEGVLGAREALAKEQAVARARAEAQAAALKEHDSNGMFDFDSWHDTDAATKAAASKAAKEAAAAAPKAPRYISQLLDKAKDRDFEREAAFERKLARERQKEEEELGPTESFVTAAYAAKLEERKAREAAEKAKEAAEARSDVTKKGDMSDFYRNMAKNVALGGPVTGSHADEMVGGASLGPDGQSSSRSEANMAKAPLRSGSQPVTNASGAHVAAPTHTSSAARSRSGSKDSAGAPQHGTKRQRTGSVVGGSDHGDVPDAAPDLGEGRTAQAAAEGSDEDEDTDAAPSSAAASPALPAWARRTSRQEIEEARLRAVARIAARKSGGYNAHDR